MGYGAGILSVFFAILAAMIIHESGHFLAALFFGQRLKFRFSWGTLGKMLVPRFVWTMPVLVRRKQRIIALAGFVLEVLFIPLFACAFRTFGIVYMSVVALHLIAYRFYAGDSNDFKWI